MITVYEIPVGIVPLEALFAEARADRPYIASALSGESPARVLVDDPKRPSTALIARTYEYFLGGATGTALDHFIIDAAPEVGIWQDFYGFVATTSEWNARLPTLVPSLEWIGRRTFRIEQPEVATISTWREDVPADVEIVPLTVELAELADREMPEIIGRFWSGYERYGERGFGSVALIDGHPVSIAYSVGVGGGEANVGVMTVESQRRRGLAALCSRAWIEQCYERGLVPTWDCDEANPASAALALSIGFMEQAGFNEWANPERKPRVGEAGLWTRSNGDYGVVRWTRR
jgi:GNAT superfamily N-acetyltransferase